MIEQGSRNLLLLGAHRSGTSLAAEIVHTLGVELRRPGGLVPASGSNPRGHWEDQEIVDINTELLRARGATAVGPPLDDGWPEGPDTLVEGIASQISSVLGDGSEGWMAKDPRFCHTLPVWQRAMRAQGVDAAYVLVNRHPTEVAASLDARDSIPPDAGLAIWIRSIRSALASLRGEPVFILGYEDTLKQPHVTIPQLESFLDSNGIRRTDPRSASSCIDPLLRHQRTHGSDPTGTSRDAIDLYAEVRRMHGAHPNLRVELPPEPEWCQGVLEIATPLLSLIDREKLDALRIQDEYDRYREKVARWTSLFAPGTSRRRKIVRALDRRLRPQR